MKYYVIYKYWGSLENKYINIKTAAIKPLKRVIAAVFITYLVSINEYSYAILILFSICLIFYVKGSPLHVLPQLVAL